MLAPRHTEVHPCLSAPHESLSHRLRRSDYEVRIGAFEGAVDLKLDSFREFPEAIKSLPEVSSRR